MKKLSKSQDKRIKVQKDVKKGNPVKNNKVKQKTSNNYVMAHTKSNNLFFGKLVSIKDGIVSMEQVSLITGVKKVQQLTKMKLKGMFKKDDLFIFPPLDKVIFKNFHEISYLTKDVVKSLLENISSIEEIEKHHKEKEKEHPLHALFS